MKILKSHDELLRQIKAKKSEQMKEVDKIEAEWDAKIKANKDECDRVKAEIHTKYVAIQKDMADKKEEIVKRERDKIEAEYEQKVNGLHLAFTEFSIDAPETLSASLPEPPKQRTDLFIGLKPVQTQKDKRFYAFIEAISNIYGEFRYDDVHRALRNHSAFVGLKSDAFGKFISSCLTTLEARKILPKLIVSLGNGLYRVSTQEEIVTHLNNHRFVQDDEVSIIEAAALAHVSTKKIKDLIESGMIKAENAFTSSGSRAIVMKKSDVIAAFADNLEDTQCVNNQDNCKVTVVESQSGEHNG